MKRKSKGREVLESRIIRAVQYYICEEDKDDVTLDAVIIDGLGLDSLDTTELTFAIESEFGLKEKEVVWDAFWSNRQVTVRDLCDFIERRM